MADVAKMAGVSAMTVSRALKGNGSVTKETRDRIMRAVNELVRTVRAVVWRRSTEDGIQIVPIIPWEQVDYVPYEVLDYPDEDR